jgi:hypothetical protein
LLSTGIILLIFGDGSNQDQSFLLLNSEQWLNVHHLMTLIALPLVFLHIAMHWKVILKLLSPRTHFRHKPLNLSLLVLFTLTTGTGLTAWLVYKVPQSDEWLHSIHNKLGMALIVFYATHLALYASWLFRKK